MLTEQEFKDKYEPRIRDVKYGELQSFIDEMFAEELDYGTICYALGFAAAAAAWSCDKHPSKGGITGFQSGFVLWEFIRQWDKSMIGDIGARILAMSDLLYPQLEYKFTTISADTWALVQQKARDELAKPNEFTAQSVRDHWQYIIDGTIPFGLKIQE